MIIFIRDFALFPALFLLIGAYHAANYQGTIDMFKGAGASGAFFGKSYAYAVFPTVASGAFTVGGAYGKGRVYVHGVYAGDTTMGQLSLGFQAGGEAYSQIYIFFEDKRALDEFESGNFEFGADASVVAITAGANAGAATDGASAGAGFQTERCQDAWNLSKGHGSVHRCQRWPDVLGGCGRAEILVFSARGELATRADCACNKEFSKCHEY